MNKNYLKTAIISFIAIIIYFFKSNLAVLPFKLLGTDYTALPQFIKVTYSLSVELLFIVILFIFFKKTVIENFKDLKVNHKEYFKKYAKYWFLLIGIMLCSNLLIMLFTEAGLPDNEQTIRESFKQAPIYIYISAVFLAPIIEEFIFRQSFRNIITNNWLFIIVSGLVFGGLHIISNYEAPIDLLYLIPYSTPGMIFAYVLVKSKNIFVSIGLHLFHNGICLSLQFLALLLS